MKIRLLTTRLLAGIVLLINTPFTQAQTAGSSCDENCTCTGGKAPIGVMGDHMHKEGEWMFSYRLMYMNMEGNRQGTDNLSNHQVFEQGYELAPVEMQMEMHMFGAMYAPSDDLTLMLMANYVRKDMDMISMSGEGMMHAMETHDTMTMDHGTSGGHGDGTHNHSTSGWGDTVVTALFRLWGDCCQSIHAGLGIGLPTADVENRQGDMYQPYGMQLGNGVWDARPSLTYNGGGCSFNWGAQVSGRFNLEDENDAGFAFGDQISATTWISKDVASGIRLSGRVLYDHQNDIEGHYNEPHSHASPPYFQENFGGDVVQAGLGVNLSDNGGQSLSIEALVPVYEDLNGVQLSRDYSVILGWQKSL